VSNKCQISYKRWNDERIENIRYRKKETTKERIGYLPVYKYTASVVAQPRSPNFLLPLLFCLRGRRADDVTAST
jgi:hypothetical protein